MPLWQKPHADAGLVRPMAFAGAWYPRETEACRAAITQYAAGSPPSKRPSAPGAPLMGVVPHAGWAYSGALAGAVFANLGRSPGRNPPTLAVVLGGHLGAWDEVVAIEEGQGLAHWQTPLGPLKLHTGFHPALRRMGGVRWEAALGGRGAQSRPDNSVELQLPFVKYWFPQAELLPLRVPPSARAMELGRALAAYLETSGLEAVVIASTDLTHYGPAYGFTPQGTGARALEWVRHENDPAFIGALEQGRPEEILRVSREHRNACSAGATAMLAELAAVMGARFEPLAYATSADVRGGDAPGGDVENFVGYVGGVCH